MKILIVLAHPEPKSFNAAMYETAIAVLKSEGHEIKLSNLYEMNFNPVTDRTNFITVKDIDYLKLQTEEVYASENNGFESTINIEQEKIEWCDVMIWQFPLFWFSLPAILKGWVDRVFAMGRFYGSGKLYENGVFKKKKALISVTTGGPRSAYVAGGLQGDINGILKPIHRGILEFVGFSVLAPQLSFSVSHITNEERKAELERWRVRLINIFNEENIIIGHY